ncbi:threonine-phosphate decarboxylase CobD [Sinorhizobium sp. BG8]|uniref:threonine-phosphate decarboxylase CobD n=1 Tax=Sinorhizobium sp. BG8 TaxID=2613773 RepID=UPI00193E17CD|nr:threonine-phosphate decarboxylase CobD [Sinorhizobium sp. BG8]QRM55783.1 threonine-phosphate decarboxylase [Sinorhizobium sp. BG8]
MSAPRIVHGGGITAAAALFGGRPQDWLDLSTGINPCPPLLPDIEGDAWHRLPDHHRVEDARRAAAGFYGAQNCLPLPVPGTQSAIQLLPRLLLDRTRAAVLSPTYGEYGRVLADAGVPVDAVASLDAVTADHGLVVVVNPNNPDGRRFAAEELLALHDRMRSWSGMLLVDEAFGDMRPEDALAPRAGALPGLVVFRSFGKFFGLAGLRLGFALGEGKVLSQLADWLGPWAVSGPALAVASALMRGDTRAIRTSIAERKRALDDVLSGAGLTIAGGTELFTLVDHGKAADVHEALCERHILVRRFDYAPRWLRFGLTPGQKDDDRLAGALETIGAIR